MYTSESFISAIILLIFGIFFQISQPYINLFSLTLLALGCSSIKHHSRLHKWIINDKWFFLDIFCVFLFFVIYTINYYKEFYYLISVILIIIIYIISKIVNKKYCALVHSLIHYIIILILIYLINNNVK